MTTYDKKLKAWLNAHEVLGHDPAYVRRDDFGWFIQWSDYGNRQSAYGWEIDHIRPTALGGLDTASNVRALHWQNNARLGGLLGGALG